MDMDVDVDADKKDKYLTTLRVPNSLDFVDDQDIHLYHLGVVSSMNAWDPITEEVVLEASELILTPKNYPMIVMCNLGRHRTGESRSLFFSEKKMISLDPCENITNIAHQYLSLGNEYRHNRWMSKEAAALELDLDL